MPGPTCFGCGVPLEASRMEAPGRLCARCREQRVNQLTRAVFSQRTAGSGNRDPRAGQRSRR